MIINGIMSKLRFECEKRHYCGMKCIPKLGHSKFGSTTHSYLKSRC